MDFIKKVSAESDPEDEESEDSGDDEAFPLVEGPPPDENCGCICFCQEKEDGSEPEEEEELVDPQDVLKEKCSEREACTNLREKLDECQSRVESKSKTSETCVEELIDFMHCVDHCVSKTLFSKLK